MLLTQNYQCYLLKIVNVINSKLSMLFTENYQCYLLKITNAIYKNYHSFYLLISSVTISSYELSFFLLFIVFDALRILLGNFTSCP